MGLWAEMSDVQRMAHSIKTGSDWQNRAGNAGLRDQATAYLQNDSTPAIQGDNGGYGAPTPPPRTSNASNTAGMMGAVTNAIRGMNGTQTPAQLEQTRMESIQDSMGPMYVDDNDMTPADLVVSCLPPEQLPAQKPPGVSDHIWQRVQGNNYNGMNIANITHGDGATRDALVSAGYDDWVRGAYEQAMDQRAAHYGGNGSSNPWETAQFDWYSDRYGDYRGTTPTNRPAGLTFGGGSDTNNPQPRNATTPIYNNPQPYGVPTPVNQPSAAAPPGHGGGNPGYSGMLSNPAETLAGLKALTDRLRNRGG